MGNIIAGKTFLSTGKPINGSKGIVVNKKYFIPFSSSGEDVTLGFVNENGNFQALSFNGTTPTEESDSESVEFYKSFLSLRYTQTYNTLNFYKCASVDTVNHTWTGYKAVLNNGLYNFEDTISEGLTYSLDSNVPKVGFTYSDNALINADLYGTIPTSGLVFYHPLSSSFVTAPTGQTLTASGSIAYNTVDGVPCAYFDGNSYITLSDAGFPSENNTKRTISVWYKSSITGNYLAFSYGSASPYQWNTLELQYGYAGIDFYNSSVYNEFNESGKWHSAVFLINNKNVDIYLDNVLVTSQQNVNLNTLLNGTAYIGSSVFSNWSNKKYIGYMAGLRLYNRILSQTEIAALSSEFAHTS